MKEKNYAAALPYLEATVNNGSAYSAEWLSQIYLQGYDVEKDLDLAMKYALIGAELNSS